MNKYQQFVEDNEKLPSLSFPGLYPMFYLTQENNTLCGTCATKQPENVVAHRVHWEGSSVHCDECNEEIESAYGEPDEEQTMEGDYSEGK